VLNTSGGGDVIVLHPDTLLTANTTYTFQVTSALKDVSNNGFVPYSMTFTTGASTNPSANSAVNFQKTQQTTAPANAYTCVTFGPDGKLYAAARTGQIYRFTPAADGSLGVPELIDTVRTANGNANRLLTGLRFDPSSTAGNLILWVTHTFYAFTNAPDWEGKVSRLSGANLDTYQDYVTNLPRSVRDHVTNQLDFGPDGALYVMQGSNTAMGAPDSAWGFRTEHLLNAAVLRVDIAAIASRIALGQGPLNVQTEDTATPYDPFAVGAPLTIYASGTRNGYDLIWASNGHLYVPTNGSASGGSVPATPAPGGGTAADGGYIPRIDFPTNGSYKPPTTPVAAQSNLSYTEPDWLFDIHQGGYYGHPNATRNEYILNGGNPTAGADQFEVPNYPIGTVADRNYRPADVFELGTHLSADGIIQYHSNAFGGALAGKLLMVSYSGGKDIIAATLNSSGKVISTQAGFTGTTGFTGPVDLCEDPTNGNIYVADYDGQKIFLLHPVEANIGASKSRLVFSDPQGGGTSSAQTITITNTGNGDLVIPTNGLTFTGPDAAQFELVTPPTLPLTISPGNSAAIQVVFNPTSLGAKGAFLNILSNDPDTPTLSIKLRGLGTAGSQGSNEPPLRSILDTYEIPTNVGFTTLTTPYTASPIGEEVILPLLGKAGSGPVTIELLATFGPDATPDYALGFYRPGSTPTLTQLFTADSSSVAPDDPAQTLNPIVASGSTTFDPGYSAFGLFASFSSFNPTRFVYTQDALNTWDGGIRKVRFWPYKSPTGTVERNAFVVGIEEATNNDLQDVVFIIRNVRAADFTPPTIPVAGFLYQTSPHALRFQFSEDVVGLTPNDVTVYPAPTGTPIHPVLVSYEPEDHVATYTFASALPDGRYEAILTPGAITDLAGNGLDGDGNGTAGGDRTLSFYFLSGDFNHDAVVDRADFMILYNHFGQSNRLFTDGDMNGDGVVNFLDFQRFELQMNKTLPFLPAPPVLAAAKPAPKPVVKPVPPPKPVFAQRPIKIARTLPS
jgi:glucose/arabinose dehydrogenase